MKKIRIVLSICILLMWSSNIALAQEVSDNILDTLNNIEDTGAENSSVYIGDESSVNSIPALSDDSESQSTEPAITHYVVKGDVDNTKTGIDFYKNIEISLVGENLTDKNFLTKEGLHWSDKTYVELIKGSEVGILNDSKIFGKQNTPATEVKAYTNNNGDSGRINFVGKTKSGEELDLIWTVLDSDKEEWNKNSGAGNNNRVKGLGFAGEQFIPGATGNSIVVLYNNASNIGINYKIVKHGTMKEMPVVLSFISTDIDAAQGVETNLANITEIIPTESNLVKEDGIIYDKTKGVVGLNGSVDLPKGGYLGVGFLSSFDYVFYSPAPKRVGNSYNYPIAVRYDIFGSSLQANLFTRLKNHITVKYVDEDGREIKQRGNFEGFQDEKYLFESITIPKYKLIDIRKDEKDANNPKIEFVYRPVYSIKFKFVDENENILAEEKEYLLEKGYDLRYNPENIDGFIRPHIFETRIESDIEHIFVYQKEIEHNKREDENSIINKVDNVNNKKDNQKINGTKIDNSKPLVIKNKGNTPKNNKVIYNKNKARQGSANKIDPFLVNTGMDKDEKKAFLNYIKEVARASREKYKGDEDIRNKVNHDVANAIAYIPYHEDIKEKLTNDFGDRPENLDDNIKSIFENSRNKESKHRIDFPHLAAPLATSEKSVWWKQGLKWLIGFNLNGVPSEDTFFQLNSMVGDALSNLDEKDLKSNKDAYILKYHPKFKNLSLDERIEKYYYIENLDVKREKFYQEVIDIKVKENGKTKDEYLMWLSIGSVFTAGGLYLYLRKKFAQIINYFDKQIFNQLNPMANKILKPIKHLGTTKLVANREGVGIFDNKGSIVVRKIVKPVVIFVKDKIVKPVVNIVKKVVVNPIKKVGRYIYKKVVKPVYNKVIKPVVKVVKKYIVNPIYNNVIKPIYTKIIKPVGSFINRKVIQPIGKFFKKLFGKR